jgi:hypothetical protein
MRARPSINDGNASGLLRNGQRITGCALPVDRGITLRNKDCRAWCRTPGHRYSDKTRRARLAASCVLQMACALGSGLESISLYVELPAVMHP